LKCAEADASEADALSLPAWGEWIEILRSHIHRANRGSLSPHGESGLKLMAVVSNSISLTVSPRMGRVD